MKRQQQRVTNVTTERVHKNVTLPSTVLNMINRNGTPIKVSHPFYVEDYGSKGILNSSAHHNHQSYQHQQMYYDSFFHQQHVHPNYIPSYMNNEYYYGNQQEYYDVDYEQEEDEEEEEEESSAPQYVLSDEAIEMFAKTEARRKEQRRIQQMELHKKKELPNTINPLEMLPHS